jgi:enoyl-CoA hydratase
MNYDRLKGLDVTVDGGVALVRMKYQPDDQVTRRHQHEELTTIWRVLDTDPEVRSVLITGPEGGDFYLSGKPPGVSLEGAERWQSIVRLEREGAAILSEMVAFSKPVVAAVLGCAAGAGLAVALLCDISIVSENSTFFDPHAMLGLAAGDGALALWPLLTGMAKAKLYLMTSDSLDGREAERIGLVSLAVAEAQTMQVARQYAERLASGPPTSLRFIKKSLNQWYKLTGLVSQDYSLALQLLSEFSGERANSPYSEFPPRQVP